MLLTYLYGPDTVGTEDTACANSLPRCVDQYAVLLTFSTKH